MSTLSQELPMRMNVNMYQGVTLSLQWIVKRTSTQLPYQLSTYTGKAQVRRKTDKSLILTFVTSDTSMLLTDAGGIQLSTDATTANVPAGIYDWDLILTDPSAVVLPFFSGDWTVKPKVTQ